MSSKHKKQYNKTSKPTDSPQHGEAIAGYKLSAKSKGVASVSCTHNNITPIVHVDGGADEGGLTVWAGAARDFAHAFRAGSPMDVLISVGQAAQMRTATEVKGPCEMTYTGDTEKMFASVSSIKLPTVTENRVTFDWPDFGVPGFNLEWWTAFVNDLAKLKGNVGIFCMGGHGRTGTALSIITHLLNAVPDDEDDTVLWLRELYCEKAVESKEQITYLQGLGVNTTASGCKEYGGYTGGWSAADFQGGKGHTYTGGKSSGVESSVVEYASGKLQAHVEAVCEEQGTPIDTDPIVLLDSLKDPKLTKKGEKGPCVMCKAMGIWDDEEDCYLCDPCFMWIEGYVQVQLSGKANKIEGKNKE